MTTNETLNRHLGAFSRGDVDGLLADYSADAVFFVPDGTLKGPGAIRPFFEKLVAEFAKPGASFQMEQQRVVGDLAYIIWSAETAECCYEFATDTFVVRDGKIVAQSFAAKMRAKG